MTTPPQSCTEHGDTDDAWACPDDCQEFADELQRRIDDIKINGNYTRLTTDDNGFTWRQRFRNHHAVEEPQYWAAASTRRTP